MTKTAGAMPHMTALILSDFFLPPIWTYPQLNAEKLWKNRESWT